MALRFIDSYDHYDDTEIVDKYSLVASASGTPQIISGGRFTNCLRLAGGSSARMTFDDQVTWIVGFAYQHVGYGSAVNPIIMQFLDSAATTQVELRINSSTNVLFLTRNATTIATGTTVLSNLVWYYIEVKVTIDNTTGLAECRLNGSGANEMTFTGDTQNTAVASARSVHFVGGSGSPSVNDQYFDDLYICDGTGSAPANTYLGDCRVEALFPNGNGNSSQFVGSDGNSTDNYLLVDDTTTVDDDTTYVESSTVSDKDTYAMTNATPTTGTVYGVQPVPRARKTDAGTRKICSVARLSATEVDSADKTLITTYKFYPDIRETKPGGGAWTISDINSAEFGQKVTA